MKRLLILLLSLCMVLSAFSGCAAENNPYVPTGDALIYDDEDLNKLDADENAEPQKFSLAYYPDRSLNPIYSTDYTNRTILSLVYQGLFSVGNDYQAVPILCDRYEVSSNYKIYTVYLREDAKFSDGTAVTVDDVLATVEVMKAMEAEKDDLCRYLNLFGYNPKYGITGKPIGSITYKPQRFDPVAPLYDL